MMSRKVLLALASMGSALSAQTAFAQDLVVLHPPTEPPALVDAAPVGVDSPGDVRLFHYLGTTGDGEAVVMDWIMTTTAEGTAAGANSRVTQGIFSIGGAGGDQIMITGAGLYPDASATFATASQMDRSIIGGTGRFSGVTGVVVSLHLADDSWMHEFHFED